MFRNSLHYDHTIKLLEKQESKRFSEFRKNLEGDTPKNKSKSKAQKLARDSAEYQEVYPVKMALEYLSSTDKPARLMLVCRKWNLVLSKKIAKLYLMRFPEDKLLRDRRIELWLTFLRSEVPLILSK